MLTTNKLEKKIATTIFTGFLGSGKTSLIRSLALNAKGQKFAFLINEFGDLGIDGQILSGCGREDCDELAINDEDIIELANGCICCSVADDFLPAMEKILARNKNPKTEIDHIIIETSGLALPKPLIKAFNWPSIKPYLSVDSVITLVDSQAICAGLLTQNREKIEKLRQNDDVLTHETPLEELFEEQLQCADIVILSKADCVTAEQLQQIKTSIAPHLRPGTKILPSKNSKISPNLLLGLGAKAEDDLDSRYSHHDDGHAHDHDDFTSFVVKLAPMTNQKTQMLETTLKTLIATHDILRIKGFIAYANIPRREIIQAVGPHVNRYFDRDWHANETPESVLVFIGEASMPRALISQELQKLERSFSQC